MELKLLHQIIARGNKEEVTAACLAFVKSRNFYKKIAEEEKEVIQEKETIAFAKQLFSQDK